MSLRMRTLMTACAAAMPLVIAGGCADQTAMWNDPDVEWMLPESGGSTGAGSAASLGASDTIDVYAAPGLGASDALGYEIFVRHDERLAQSQMVNLMAIADASPTGQTLWLDPIAGDAMYGLFAGGPVRYAEAKPTTHEPPHTITSVDSDAINK